MDRFRIVPIYGGNLAQRRKRALLRKFNPVTRAVAYSALANNSKADIGLIVQPATVPIHDDLHSLIPISERRGAGSDVDCKPTSNEKMEINAGTENLGDEIICNFPELENFYGEQKALFHELVETRSGQPQNEESRVKLLPKRQEVTLRMKIINPTLVDAIEVNGSEMLHPVKSCDERTVGNQQSFELTQNDEKLMGLIVQAVCTSGKVDKEFAIAEIAMLNPKNSRNEVSRLYEMSLRTHRALMSKVKATVAELKLHYNSCSSLLEALEQNDN